MPGGRLRSSDHRGAGVAAIPPLRCGGPPYGPNSPTPRRPVLARRESARAILAPAPEPPRREIRARAGLRAGAFGSRVPRPGERRPERPAWHTWRSWRSRCPSTPREAPCRPDRATAPRPFADKREALFTGGGAAAGAASYHDRERARFAGADRRGGRGPRRRWRSTAGAPRVHAGRTTPVLAFECRVAWKATAALVSRRSSAMRRTARL
jgi:hypothetical protein